MRTKFDVNHGCTIDETGLIVSYAGKGKGARVNNGCNAGKKYFEAKVTLMPGSAIIGLCDAEFNLATTQSPSPTPSIFFIMVHADRFSVWYGEKIKYLSPTGVHSNPGIAGMAVDFDSRTVKYYYNGTLLVDESYVDKVTKIDAIRYPFSYSGAGADYATLEFNFGAKLFTYPIPEGYQPWDNNQRLYIKENAIYGMQNNA